MSNVLHFNIKTDRTTPRWRFVELSAQAIAAIWGPFFRNNPAYEQPKKSVAS